MAVQCCSHFASVTPILARKRDTLVPKAIPVRKNTMKTQLLVTLFGEDKPGIVARVTELFVANGANLEESRMAILGGEFAAIMLVSIEADKVEALKSKLEKLSSEGI